VDVEIPLSRLQFVSDTSGTNSSGTKNSEIEQRRTPGNVRYQYYSLSPPGAATNTEY